MLKYTANALFLHLIPGTTTLEKKRKQYQREQRNIFTTKPLHFSSTNAVLTDRVCPGWHTRHGTTRPGLHRLFLPGMLLLPLPSCPLPCLPEVCACSTVARAQSWPFYAKMAALRCQQTNVPPSPWATVLQLCPRALQKAQNWENHKTLLFTRQSWVTMILCWMSHSFPSQLPKNRMDCLLNTRTRGWHPQASRKGRAVLCGVSPDRPPPIHKLGREDVLRSTTKGRRHWSQALQAGCHQPSLPTLPLNIVSPA